MWFLYRWEAGEVSPLRENVHFMREHGRSIKQVLPVVPATTCDPSVTVKAARQAFRVFCGEADHKVYKLFGVAYPPLASSDSYGGDEN